MDLGINDNGELGDGSGIGSSNVPVQVTGLCTGLIGIDEPEQLSVSVFPNPFSCETILQTNKLLRNATFTVYNSFGRKVKREKNITGQTVSFSCNNLSAGLYFLRITEENKTIGASKLVITDK